MCFTFISELLLGYVVSSLYSQIDNKKELLKDKRIIKNIKKEIKDYYSDFERENTNTIIDSNKFCKYVKYHKPIEHLIDYLVSLSCNAGTNDSCLFDDHIEKALTYLNSDGQTLTYANKNLVISFHKDIYRIISGNLNNNLNLSNSYQLKSLQNEHRKILEVTEDILAEQREENKNINAKLDQLIFNSQQIIKQDENGNDSAIDINEDINGEYTIETYISIRDGSSFSNATELLNHAVWTCVEKTFDISKILIYQEEAIVNEIKNENIETDRDILLSRIKIKNNPALVMTLSNNNYKSFKVKIKPQDIILKCDILNERNELIYQNYKFKLTREKVGKLTRTTWIDITGNNTYSINFIHEFNEKDVNALILSKSQRNIVEIDNANVDEVKYKASVNIVCNNVSSAYSSFQYYKIYKKLANCSTLKFLYSDNGMFMSSFNFNVGNISLELLEKYTSYYQKIHEIELFISSALVLKDEGNPNIQEIVNNYYNVIKEGYSISYTRMRMPMVLEANAKSKITPDTIISFIPDNSELFGQKIFRDGLIITIPYYILEGENEKVIITNDKYIIYTDKKSYSVEKINEIIAREDTILLNERTNDEATI